MSKVRLSFSYPTRRVLGGELRADDIQGAEFTMNGAALGAVAHPERTLLTGELSPGTYSFAGVCVLKDGKRSAAVSASVVIADDSDPEVLLDLSAVIE